MKKYFLLTLIVLAIFSRFYAFDKFPPSPYWEEVALAYDAYSIAETARDHHGNFMPLASFESFGDHKPSLYFYIAVPFIKTFGLNLFAIRLPTILSSFALIFGAAVLSRFLFLQFYIPKNQKDAWKVFTISSFMAAISPWLLTFSRSAWESVLASALILWGFIFALYFIKNNKTFYLVFATVLLSLSSYAYHSARLTAPFLGVALVLAYIFFQFFIAKKSRINWKALVASFLIALVLSFPVGKSLLGQSGQQRIAETGILQNIEIIEESNDWRATYNNSWWARLIFHRNIFFAKEVASNFFSHFNFKYLFVSGDNNPRHSIQTFGNFYYLDLILFAFGFYFFLSKRRKISLLLFIYLFLAILPAAFTRATPHALRTLASWPIFIVLLTFGWWQMLDLFKSKISSKNLNLILLIAYSFLFILFFCQMMLVYPNKYKHEWQYGYKEMLQKLGERRTSYEKIYITREQGRPAMYYFFYNQTDPNLVQMESNKVKKDQGEFLSFDNVNFIDWADQIDLSKKILIVSSPKFYNSNFASYLEKIDETENQTWVFYEN